MTDSAKQNKVHSLIDSIKSKKGFKQLASYSVQCLAKVITPPHVGWEQNMKEAYEAGALDAISGVVQKHKGDDAVLASASQCLTSMSQNSEYAADVVKSGCLMSMFDSIVTNPESDSCKDTLGLVENVATKNPEALMSVNVVQFCSKYLNKVGSNETIDNETVSPVLRTLEQMNKLPEGGEQIRSYGVIPQLLSNLKRTGQDTSVIEPALRMLDRMCREESLAEYIREDCQGLDQISVSLLPHSSNAMVNQVGGRLLSKLAKGNFKGIIDEMASSENTKRKENLSNLLANLAVEEDNAEKICEAGGLSALVGVFTSNNQGSIISSSNALTRIAQSSPENIQKLVETGGVSDLIAGLVRQKGHTDASTAIVSTLASISDQAKYVGRLSSEENFNVLLEHFCDYPENVSACVHTLKIFDDIILSESGHLNTVSNEQFLTTIFKLLKKNPDNEALQLNALRQLIYVSDSESIVNKIVENDGMDVCLHNMKKEHASVPLLKASFFLLTSLCMVEDNYVLLKSSGGLDLAMQAIHMHRENTALKSETKELLETITKPENLQGTVDKLKACHESFLVNPTERSAEGFTNLASELGGLAVLPENSRKLIEDTPIIPTILSTISSISKLRALPYRSEVLSSCAELMEGISCVKGVQECPSTLLEPSTMSALVESLKLHSKVENFALPVASIIRHAASSENGIERVVSEGGIEACITALRAHPDNRGILSNVMEALVTIASSPGGGETLVEHGATRQIILSLKHHVGNPELRGSIEMMLTCLMQVSMNSTGIELLTKQGAVDAVLDAAAVLEANSSASKVATEILSKLLTSSDVNRGMQELDDILPKLNSLSKSKEGVDAIERAVARIGHMSSVGALCDTIVSDDGQTKLGKLMDYAINGCTVEGQQCSILEKTFKATAEIARVSRGKVDPDQFVPSIITASNSGLAVPEALKCYQGIASQGEEFAIKILKNPAAVESITRIGNTQMRNHKVAEAFFGTIHSFSKADEPRNIISGTTAVTNILKYIDNHSEEATPELMSHALESLSGLAQICHHKVLTADSIEVIKTVLARFCPEGKEPDPKVFGGIITCVYETTKGDLKFASKTVMESGLLKKLLKVCRGAKSDSLVHHLDAIKPTISLIGSMASEEEVREALVQMQAAAVVFAGMDAHGSNQEFLQSAVLALKNLKMDSEMGTMAVRDVNKISSELEASRSISDSDVRRLGGALENLSKFMLLDGVVTEDTAESILQSLSKAVGILAESAGVVSDSGFDMDDVLASGINSIGVVARMIPGVTTSEAIQFVLDTLSLQLSSQKVCLATLKCLPALSNSAEAFITLNTDGGFALLEAVTQKNVANLHMQKTVEEASINIAEAAFAHLEDLCTTEGIVACASAILVLRDSLERFREFLSRLSESPERLNVLFQVLQRLPEGSYEAYTIACKAIQDALDEENNFDRSFAQSCLNFALSGTVTALESNLNSQHLHDNISALMKISGSLEYTSDMGEDLMAQSADVYDNLFSISNLPADICSVTFMSMERHLADAEGASYRAAAYAATDVPMNIIKRLRKLKTEDPGVGVEAMRVLLQLVTLLGVEHSGIEQIAIGQLNAIALEKSHEELSSTATKLVALLKDHFGDATAMVASSLASSTTSLQSFSLEQAETSNEVFDDFRVTMDSVYECIDQCEEDEVVAVSSASIGYVIRAMGVAKCHADTAMVLKSMQALTKVSTRQDNCIEIAEQGGIGAILEAVRNDPENGQLVQLLSELMEKISRNEEYKPVIPDEGGISVAIEIGLGKHMGNLTTTTKTLSTLANLAFNSPENVETICSQGGIGAILDAMKEHPNTLDVLENGTCTLSNLMCGSDANKLAIGKSSLHLIVDIIKRYISEPRCLKMSLRALGNLAYLDENIALAVRVHNTGEILVDVIRTSKDEQAIQLAIEVLGNFFGFDEEDESYNQKDYSSLAFTLYHQGVGKVLLDAMKNNKMNSAILKSAIEALANMVQDEELTHQFTDDFDVVALLTEIMHLHDWDMELLQCILPLIATLSYAVKTQELLAENDGVTLILDALEGQLKLLKNIKSGSMEDEEELAGKTEIVENSINSCCIILANISASEFGREKLLETEGSVRAIKLAEPFQHEMEFLTELFTALTRMCSSDELSSQIADTGMHIITNALENYADDTQFLITALRLLGHLAYVESNLRHIVQHDGIIRVIRAITRHPDCRDLVLRGIQTIDNVAMISNENAMLVVEQGAQDLLKAISETYSNDPEIPQYARSAQLSMQQVQQNTFIENKLAAKKESAVQETEASVDTLKPHRNMLRAGSVMKVWKKGTPKDAHVRMATDFHSVIWEDPKSQKSMGALDMKKVTRVERTTGPGHKKKMLGKKVDESCCFIVETDAHTLCCETSTVGDAKKWVTALAEVNNVAKKTPQKL